MNTQPAKYWRKEQKEKLLLGQTGTIKTLTRLEDSNRHLAIIKLENNSQITGEVISPLTSPKIGDTVSATVRIKKKSSPSSLIEYGIKWLIRE